MNEELKPRPPTCKTCFWHKPLDKCRHPTSNPTGLDSGMKSCWLERSWVGKCNESGQLWMKASPSLPARQGIAAFLITKIKEYSR